MLLKILQHELLGVKDKFPQFLADFMASKNVMDVFFKQFVHFEIFQMTVTRLWRISDK